MYSLTATTQATFARSQFAAAFGLGYQASMDHQHNLGAKNRGRDDGERYEVDVSADDQIEARRAERVQEALCHILRPTPYSRGLIGQAGGQRLFRGIGHPADGGDHPLNLRFAAQSDEQVAIVLGDPAMPAERVRQQCEYAQ